MSLQCYSLQFVLSKSPCFGTNVGQLKNFGGRLVSATPHSQGSLQNVKLTAIRTAAITPTLTVSFRTSMPYYSETRQAKAITV